MIKKITDFNCLSGVSSPLLPLIYTEGVFLQNDSDGAFMQFNPEGECTAVFSLKNNCVTFIEIKNIDWDELNSFFTLFGVKTVTSDKPLSCILKMCEYPLLSFKGELSRIDECKALDYLSNTDEYKSVYNIVFETGNSFENWFPEFSRKINSFNSFATYISENEKNVSAALATAVYKNQAVIAGVSTLCEFRKKGYASKCVKALVYKLLSNGIKDINLWCSNENVPFYYKNGFEIKSKIFVGECI